MDELLLRNLPLYENSFFFKLIELLNQSRNATEIIEHLRNSVYCTYSNIGLHLFYILPDGKNY